MIRKLHSSRRSQRQCILGVKNHSQKYKRRHRKHPRHCSCPFYPHSFFNPSYPSTIMPPTNNTNNTNNHNSTAKEGLVNKLQEAMAKFRKDRDQLHRSKELASERCRLIKSEEEALLKMVQTMRDKLAHLQTSKTKIESQMGPLEVKVQKDSLEVRSASKAHGIEALLDHSRTFFSNSNICCYIFRCNSSTTNCSMLVTRSSS